MFERRAAVLPRPARLNAALPTPSGRRASTRRPCHACSISTDQPPRVALVARTAVLDPAARSEVHYNDVESSNLDGHSDAALWWRFSKAPPRPNPQTPPPRGAIGRGMRCETWRDCWSVEGPRGTGFELQKARGTVLSHNPHAFVLQTESRSVEHGDPLYSTFPTRFHQLN